VRGIDDKDEKLNGIGKGLISVLLEIYLAFQRWKNFENPLKLTKLSPWMWCTTFLGHSVY